MGLGLGYIPAEYELFGVPFNQRGARLNETIEILKLMWTQDRVSYRGKHFALDDIPVHIRPIQQPHPPLWIGAGSPAGIRRAARLGDVWPITPQVKPADLALASWARSSTQGRRWAGPGADGSRCDARSWSAGTARTP